MAAVDYFIKIDGVEGESTDSKHKGEIDLEQFSWGATHITPRDSASGMATGRGKVTVQDFHFTMKTSKASPKLFLACCNGQRFKTAVLVARKAGKDQQEYLKVTLSDCMVTKFEAGASADDMVPSEKIGLNFSKIEIEYKDQKNDGSLGGATKAGYDLKANKAV